MDVQFWGFVISGAVTVLGFLGFAIHTSWQLGQIKGSLDRDLIHLRDESSDHEDRIRALEHAPPFHAAAYGRA